MTTKKSKTEKKNAKKAAHDDDTVITTPVQEEQQEATSANAADMDDDDIDFDNDDDDDGDDSETASATAEKKGPGRGKGPRRPRQIYYECGAVVIVDDEHKLAMDKTPVKSPARGEEFNRDAAKAEAIEKFAQQHNVEPQVVHGPFYDVKGQVVGARKRETLRTTTEEIRFTGQRSSGIYNGWEVVANHLQDGTTAMVWFNKRITPFVPETPGQKPPPKPTPKHLPLNLIQDLKLQTNE